MEKLKHSPNEILYEIYDYIPLNCFNCSNKIILDNINTMKVLNNSRYYCFCSNYCSYEYFLSGII